jgi:hypothetical protein
MENIETIFEKDKIIFLSYTSEIKGKHSINGGFVPVGLLARVIDTDSLRKRAFVVGLELCSVGGYGRLVIDKDDQKYLAGAEIDIDDEGISLLNPENPDNDSLVAEGYNIEPIVGDLIDIMNSLNLRAENEAFANIIPYAAKQI